jgi:uridylate kinase
MSSSDDSSHSSVASLGNLSFSGEDDNDDFEGEKTDQEVSKYSFYDRLEHYKEENRKSVELAIMVEAGANVREMDVMTKELRANRFHSEYVGIVAEIPDSRFEDDSLRDESMQHRFKGMRKGNMSAENLHRKYENELTTL